MLNDNYNIANLPTLDIPRSKFDKSHKHLTTFNVGELVPIFIDEVLPGTTVNIRTNKLVRLQTLITPIFDNLMMDTYFFFCPSRLVWKHWKQFMGENTDSAWYSQVQYEVPEIVSETGFPLGSVADHFGIPIGCDNTKVNALPFRMYATIWNEFFRDENLSSPVFVPDGDDTVYATRTGNYINDGARGLDCLPVAKYKDVFTTALPSPQKGPSVSLETSLNGFAPVGTYSGTVWSDDSPPMSQLVLGPHTGNTAYSVLGARNDNGQVRSFSNVNLSNATQDHLYPMNLAAWFGTENLDSPTDIGEDMSVVGSVSINNLRLAFATQRLLETDARYGSRYTEIITGHFGLTSPDARLQRPEFIGGNHCHLYVDSVVQQSETSESSPLGDLAAYSVTADSNDDVSAYSCLEHGFIIGVACVRYEHTYQQGLDKMWSRRDRLDYFWPEFSNLGEIGIKGQEICMLPYDDADDPDGVDEEYDRQAVFGFQEFGYDYRMKRNYVTGEMHSNINNTLDYWHLADNYSSHPVLGHSWIKEDGKVVDRVIAVSQRVSNQVLADFFFEYEYVAPMPVYSIPAFLDMR